MIQSIKLKTSSILQVPISKYQNDFSFIVNGEEYQTSFIVADLLSTKISKIHLSDPTMNKYFINTHTKGDFNHFLNLQNFEEKESLSKNDVLFFTEIIKELGTESFDLKILTPELTIDNVFEQFNLYLQSNFFNSQQYKSCIDFISSNFTKIVEKHKERIYDLKIEVFEEIFENSNFQIESEDELLKFINELYTKDSRCSDLYQFVYFSNVEESTIDDFLRVFDINDMNSRVWESISMRLRSEIVNKDAKNEGRYKTTKKKSKKEKEGYKQILYSNEEFEGILKFFGSNIDNEIKPTSSLSYDGYTKNVLKINSSYLGTKDESNSWVCFKFLKRMIIPTHYTIKSNCNFPYHMKSWVVEGSADGANWEKIDEQINCSFLNGMNNVHTFPISNEEEHEFKYIRIRQTGKNWGGTDGLYLSRVEFYGSISQ